MARRSTAYMQDILHPLLEQGLSVRAAAKAYNEKAKQEGYLPITNDKVWRIRKKLIEKGVLKKEEPQ